MVIDIICEESLFFADSTRKLVDFHNNILMLIAVEFDSKRPSQQFSSYVRMDLPGLNHYQARIYVSCSRKQHSNADETRTRGPSVSSKAHIPLSHCVSAVLMQLKVTLSPTITRTRNLGNHMIIIQKHKPYDKIK